MNSASFLAAASEDRADGLARASEMYRQKAAQYSVQLKRLQQEHVALQSRAEALEMAAAQGEQLRMQLSASEEEKEYWKSKCHHMAAHQSQLEAGVRQYQQEAERARIKMQSSSAAAVLPPHFASSSRREQQQQQQEVAPPGPHYNNVNAVPTATTNSVGVGTADDAHFLMVGHKTSSSQTLLDLDRLQRQLAEAQEQKLLIEQRSVKLEVQSSHEVGSLKQQLLLAQEGQEFQMSERERQLQRKFESTRSNLEQEHTDALRRLEQQHCAQKTHLEERLGAEIQDEKRKKEELEGKMSAVQEQTRQTVFSLEHRLEASAQAHKQQQAAQHELQIALTEADDKAKSATEEAAKAKETFDTELGRQREMVEHAMRDHGEQTATVVEQLRLEVGQLKRERDEAIDRADTQDKKTRTQTLEMQDRITNLQVEVSKLLDQRKHLERELRASGENTVTHQQTAFHQSQPPLNPHHQQHLHPLTAKGQQAIPRTTSAPPLLPTSSNPHHHQHQHDVSLLAGGGSVMERNRAIWELQAKLLQKPQSPAPPTPTPVGSGAGMMMGEGSPTRPVASPPQQSRSEGNKRGQQELASLMNLLKSSHGSSSS